MFLLVPAYPACPEQMAVKLLLLLLYEDSVSVAIVQLCLLAC